MMIIEINKEEPSQDLNRCITPEYFVIPKNLLTSRINLAKLEISSATFKGRKFPNWMANLPITHLLIIDRESKIKTFPLFASKLKQITSLRISGFEDVDTRWCRLIIFPIRP